MKGVSAVLVVDDDMIETLMEHEGVRPKMQDLVNCSEPRSASRRCWTPVLDVDTARDFLDAAKALLEVIRT
jgi:hypothetical protein